MRAGSCRETWRSVTVVRAGRTWHICAMRRASVILMALGVALPAQAQAQAPAPVAAVQPKLALGLERVGGKRLTALT